MNFFERLRGTGGNKHEETNKSLEGSSEWINFLERTSPVTAEEMVKQGDLEINNLLHELEGVANTDLISLAQIKEDGTELPEKVFVAGPLREALQEGQKLTDKERWAYSIKTKEGEEWRPFNSCSFDRIDDGPDGKYLKGFRIVPDLSVVSEGGEKEPWRQVERNFGVIKGGKNNEK